MRPAISHADLLRAFNALNPESSDEKAAIAELLGLEWAAPSLPRPQSKSALSQHEQSGMARIVAPPAAAAAAQAASQPAIVDSGEERAFDVSGPATRDSGSALWSMPAGDFDPTPSAP